MEKPGIILIGDSPGIYMCGIYLHTANVPFTLIRKNFSMQYDCRFIAGIPGIKKQDFDERCLRQAQEMGIRLTPAQDLSVEACGDEFKVTNGPECCLANVLVMDTNACGLEPRTNLFFITDKVRVNEAIDVAGAGCKTAFMVRAYLE